MKKYFTLPAIFFIILFPGIIGLDLGVGVVPGFSRFYGKHTIVTLKPSIGVEYFPKDTFSWEVKFPLFSLTMIMMITSGSV